MTMSEERGIPAETAIMSFLAGAAIGAGLALLYTPKSGSQMRETLGDFSENTINKIKGFTKDAQKKIKTVVDDGKEKISEKKAILTSAIEAGREAMQKNIMKRATDD